MKKLSFIAVLALLAPLANAGEMATSSNPGTESASFSEVDANQDGMITKEEAQPFAAVEVIFDNADANQDGALDADEFSASQGGSE
jgi:hypothetical protein